MFQQRVIIRGPLQAFSGKRGIVVAVFIPGSQSSILEEGYRAYKVLVDNVLTPWIPAQWIEFV